MNRVDKKQKVTFRKYGLYENNPYLREFIREMESAIEETFHDDPPYISLRGYRDDDVVGRISLSALSDGDDLGPTWEFSLREYLEDDFYNMEGGEKIPETLEKMAEYLRNLKK